MKKWIIGVLAALMTAGLLLGSSAEKPEPPKQSERTLKIVCSTFPEYDWVRNLTDGVEGIELRLLTDNGVDLHSYQPSAAHIVQITDSDLFLYIGGTSDQWAKKLVQENRQGKESISLLDALGDAVREEELVEGMQEERHSHEGHAEQHDHEEHDHGQDLAEYDEHVWLSLNNAELLCGEITEALARLDGDNAGRYRENYETYLAKLKNLDEQYRQTVETGARKTILFADRFPFRYLADDYGLNYYAAFAGCSAETEASFETIVFLSRKLSEESLPAVLVLENSNQSLAKTVANAVPGKKPEILVLDSMQSMTRERIEQGVSYLSLMEQNLEVLKKALS